MKFKIQCTKVIARFNSFKKFGPRFGRTQDSPLPVHLYKEKENLALDLRWPPHHSIIPLFHHSRCERSELIYYGITNKIGKLDPVLDAQLSINTMNMVLDRLERNIKCVGNLLVTLAFTD